MHSIVLICSNGIYPDAFRLLSSVGLQGQQLTPELLRLTHTTQARLQLQVFIACGMPCNGLLLIHVVLLCGT